MGKQTLASFGNLKIKMDTGSTESRDKKDPHVSLKSDEKEAIYYLRKNKNSLISEYKK